MSELSSLLFVNTDELGRPTGLVASNEEDNLASALMPQDVKDTVFVVSSSKVSSNYTAWDSVSAVSGLQALSGVSADVSVIGEISGVIYDGSDGWNAVSSVSGLQELSGVSADISAIGPVSATVRDGSNGWNSVSSVSGLQELAGVSADISAVSSLSALLFDGSTILSSLSGVVSGAAGGPDVAIFSALNNLARVLRYVDASTNIDKGFGTPGDGVVAINSINSIRSPVGKVLALGALDPSGKTAASVKLDWVETESVGVSYLSGGVVGLVGIDDIRIGSTNLDLLPTGASSIKGLYSNGQTVSGIVDTGSGVMVTLSGDRGGGLTRAESLSALDKVLYSTNPSDPDAGSIKVATNLGLSGERMQITGKVAVTLLAENDTIFIGSALTAGAFSQYTTNDFIKVKEAKNYIVDNDVSASLNTSGNWDSVYTSVGNTSSNWESTYNDVTFSSSDWNGTRDTVFANSGGWEGGGGGDSREASALLIGGGNYAQIIGDAESNQILVYNGTNFAYRNQALPSAGEPGTPLGNTFNAPSGDVTYNFGPSASIAGGQTLDFSGSFTSSGLAKTLLEFDDKSRVALGRSNVPLEISAFGQSDVRLVSDNTNGAFVLVEGTDSAPSLVHLKNVDLSADADCQIDFDTDINMGGSTHLVGNTIGSNHIACKNTHGSTLTAGTPVFIKGFVGSGASGKIEIGAASASVASTMPAIGVLSLDLTANEEGYVDAFGVADGIDTQTPGFALQDTLYVASGGGLTNVRPTATSDLVQNIGIVERVDSSQGKIIVLGPGRTNDVPNSPIKLLSTKYTGTGNIPTSLGTVDWASPTLNTGNISYSTGEFTIPAAMAGDFLEFNIQLGVDTALTPSRIKLEMELQKDTGSGYTTEAAAANYVVRNNNIEKGSISIPGYIDPAAVSSGDKYRVQVLQVAEGNAGQFWPDACKISIKAHHP